MILIRKPRPPRRTPQIAYLESLDRPAWKVNVGTVEDKCWYYYDNRANATKANIVHKIGEYGRIG